ncbi:MAG: penicillin-binding protein [Bradymonadia bacterium]
MSRRNRKITHKSSRPTSPRHTPPKGMRSRNARRRGDSTRSHAVKGVRLGRMSTVFTLLMVVYAVLMVRAWMLQVHRHEHYVDKADRQHKRLVTLRARRGQIRDRGGQVLANTANGKSVGAFRQDLGEQAEASVQALSEILRLDRRSIHRKLVGNKKGFVWLKRHVTPEEAKAIEAAKLPGVVVEVEPRRFYPKGTLAGPLLGFTNIDGLGSGGLEKTFDRYLQGQVYTLEALRDAKGRRLLTDGYLPAEKLRGLDVVLTIDSYIQQVAEEALTTHVKKMRAKEGLVVVLDPATGDILAMAQTPEFDPNLYRRSKAADRRIRSVVNVLEPGSTIKPLLVASALDARVVRPNMVWDGMKGRMKLGRRTIRDAHVEESFTTYEVVQKSSNIGAVQIAQRLGKSDYHGYLKAFGFGETTGVELPGEARGVLNDFRRWGTTHLATHAYGYGLSVTPLQMATAMATLANDGVRMKPRLVQAVVDGTGEVVRDFPPREVRTVIKPKAVKQIREALVMVTQPGGTGTPARVPGYVVAGKTGTARKLINGKYSKDHTVASFSGFAPAQSPKVVIYVMVDEPKEAKSGSKAAAPVFSAIASKVLPYLGVQPTEHYAHESARQVQEPIPELDAQATPWWFTSDKIAGGATHVRTPDLRGMSLKELLSAVKPIGRHVEIEGAGLVVEQKPQAGALLAPEQTLTVVLALPGARTGEGM